MSTTLENSTVTTGLEKVSFHSIPKKGNAKECSNYCAAVLISHASKVMFKILLARLQQYVSQELPDVKMGLSKSRGTRIKLPTCTGSLRKQGEFQKNIYFCFTDYTKAFDYEITTNREKFLKRWEYQTTLSAS